MCVKNRNMKVFPLFMDVYNVNFITYDKHNNKTSILGDAIQSGQMSMANDILNFIDKYQSYLPNLNTVKIANFILFVFS